MWPNRAIWSSLGLDLKDHKQRAVAQTWLQDALGLDAAEPPETASEWAQPPGLGCCAPDHVDIDSDLSQLRPRLAA